MSPAALLLLPSPSTKVILVGANPFTSSPMVSLPHTKGGRGGRACRQCESSCEKSRKPPSPCWHPLSSVASSVIRNLREGRTKHLLKDALLMWTSTSLSEGPCPFDDHCDRSPAHNLISICNGNYHPGNLRGLTATPSSWAISSIQRV